MARFLRIAGSGGTAGFALAHAAKSGIASIWVLTVVFVAFQVVGFWMEPTK